jgi:hypothetical protein
MATLPDPLAAMGLHGLWVDAGHYNHRAGRWVREPFAAFTCRHGCLRTAAGARDVAAFCQAIDAWHTVNCARKEHA